LYCIYISCWAAAPGFSIQDSAGSRAHAPGTRHQEPGDGRAEIAKICFARCGNEKNISARGTMDGGMLPLMPCNFNAEYYL